ncbi:MAG: branched-chain amino acid ABC transporter permease [Candidatus Tectimicrobiota bacterium]|nr:MAG: branched-chain amino acid ABC transporter permease [Candidatus Tectomicrobia bacterium]
MRKRSLLSLLGIVLLALLPLSNIETHEPYAYHILILVLLWGSIYTAWSLMGKYGFVSLGHGAFLGVAVYTVTLLWNYLHLTPWLGMPIALGLCVVLAVLIGYPCFRLRVVGHYFALVTLALGEVVRLTIIAARDYTGGSLGITPARVQPPTPVSWYALQFADRDYFYFLALALWLLTLGVWRWVSRSMSDSALNAISEDEVAAASLGIHVTGEKLRITLISAVMTGLGGILFAQYNMYLNPETLAGVGVSLEIVFAAIAGGMYVALGPTVGALLTISLREYLRVLFGTQFIGAANTIYGILLIIFIIFMPQGILGTLLAWWRRRFGTAPQPQA